MAAAKQPALRPNWCRDHDLVIRCRANLRRCVRRHRDRSALYAGRSKTVPGPRLRGAVAAAARHRFFSFAHRWPRRPARPALILQSLGCAVPAVWPDFNRYAGAAVLGSPGHLLELVQAGETAPPNCRIFRARSTPPRSICACASMPARSASAAGVWAPRKSRRRSKSSRPRDARPAATIISSASETARSRPLSFPCHPFALAFAQGNGGPLPAGTALTSL